jgi:hypothetical protein
MRRLVNPVRRRQQELGWSDEHTAYRVRIELERYLMIVNGNGNPEPDEIEKIVAEMALARNELLNWVRTSTAQAERGLQSFRE